jgi:FlaA1/EpsC-like NDP-sugar epimerase
LNHQKKTKFLAVRFGNVLGSRGSVIPIFQEQIKRGAPITVTDPKMMRYFMTIPEAVLLVLQAGAMGKGGEVFVLDMEEPTNIYEIAQELIRLHGLEPEKDIPIVFTGVRPGEKLSEEIIGANERAEPTVHPKIFKSIASIVPDGAYLDKKLTQLEDFAGQYNSTGIVEVLKELVPTYCP